METRELIEKCLEKLRTEWALKKALHYIQMLMEAVYTQDGDYALKAAPQLVSALNGQGVEMVEYSPEHRDWFELFPGTEDGLTIRPALVKDGKLLARGQATEVA